MALDVLANLVAQLPELRAEHERLGKLIQAIEAYAGEHPAAPVANAAHRPATGKVTLRTDQFFGKNTAEATKEYLALMRTPMGPRAIAEGLVAGGQGVDVETVYANVASALKRMKKAEEVVQVKRNHWGLAAWYGSRRRRESGATKAEGGGNGGNGGTSETAETDELDLGELRPTETSEAGS